MLGGVGAADQRGLLGGRCVRGARGGRREDAGHGWPGPYAVCCGVGILLMNDLHEDPFCAERGIWRSDTQPWLCAVDRSEAAAGEQQEGEIPHILRAALPPGGAARDDQRRRLGNPACLELGRRQTCGDARVCLEIAIARHGRRPLHGCAARRSSARVVQLSACVFQKFRVHAVQERRVDLVRSPQRGRSSLLSPRARNIWNTQTLSWTTRSLERRASRRGQRETLKRGEQLTTRDPTAERIKSRLASVKSSTKGRSFLVDSPADWIFQNWILVEFNVDWSKGPRGVIT